MTVNMLFLIVALVCFGLQAFGQGRGRVHFGWLGMCFIVGSMLFAGVLLR